MRLAALLAAVVLALTACGSSSDPDPVDTSIPKGLLTDDEEQALKDADNAPDAVGLWALCSDYAKSRVSGSWKFPYPDDAKVRKSGPGYKITGPALGPGDQTFTLSCVYKDITADGATRVSYNLQ